MARTPEGKVKDAVVLILKEFGVYYFFPATGGFGKAGVPDIIACHRGKFIGIECKAGKGVATELQKRELDRINQAGGVGIVVNEYNIDVVREILNEIGIKSR